MSAVALERYHFKFLQQAGMGYGLLVAVSFSCSRDVVRDAFSASNVAMVRDCSCTNARESLSTERLGITKGDVLLTSGGRGRGDIIGGDETGVIGGVSTRSKLANQGTSFDTGLPICSFANLSICIWKNGKSEGRTN